MPATDPKGTQVTTADENLHERKCSACGAPILQRRTRRGGITYRYACTCDGSAPVDLHEGWEPVRPPTHEAS